MHGRRWKCRGALEHISRKPVGGSGSRCAGAASGPNAGIFAVFQVWSRPGFGDSLGQRRRPGLLRCALLLGCFWACSGGANSGGATEEPSPSSDLNASADAARNKELGDDTDVDPGGHSGDARSARAFGQDGGDAAAAARDGAESTPAGIEPVAPVTGTLPAVSDVAELGPFTEQSEIGVGPGGAYRLHYPLELGRGGVRHPIVLFAAAGGFPGMYSTLFRALASHGFVVLTYVTTPTGPELIDGFGWLIDQNRVEGSPFIGKLQTTKAAAMGHSYGSIAIFNVAGDPDIVTTVHLHGGTLAPHREVAQLRAPAVFLCGDFPAAGDDGIWNGDIATPNCEIDFERAAVPVFYGRMAGAAHVQVTDAIEDSQDPLRKRIIGVAVAWLRWRLAGDTTQGRRFAGPDCDLCQTGSGWTVKQKGAF